MKKHLLAITSLSMVFSLSACSNADTPDKGYAAAPQQQESKAINQTPPPEKLSKGTKIMSKWYTGTLQHIDLEGGFYGFIGENGERFLPLNLDQKYKQNGAKVKLLGHIDKDIMTIQMWGTPFKVIEVEVLEPGTNTIDKKLL